MALGGGSGLGHVLHKGTKKPELDMNEAQVCRLEPGCKNGTIPESGTRKVSGSLTDLLCWRTWTWS